MAKKTHKPGNRMAAKKRMSARAAAMMDVGLRVPKPTPGTAIPGETDPVTGEPMMANGGRWIQGAIKHPGAERNAAKRAGMSTHAYMEEHAHDSGKAGARARLGLRLEAMNRR